MEELLVASLICLLSACVAYDFAIQDISKHVDQRSYNVPKF